MSAQKIDPDARLSLLQSAYDDIVDNFRADGLRITIERAVSFTQDSTKYGLRVERERKTASGRPGKPVPIVFLVNNPDETPAMMLRTLADVFEQARND